MNFKKILGTGLVAGAITMSSIGSAGATVSFGDGVGYIGRGDVIDNPTLGKAALVTNPVVSFAADGVYIQSCMKTTPNKPTMYKDFEEGTQGVSYEVDVETKSAKGSQTISGYRLSYTEDAVSGDAPTRVCPNQHGWQVNPDGQFPTPTLNGDDTGRLIFTAGLLSGSWIYDGEANEGAGGWVAVQPVTP